MAGMRGRATHSGLIDAKRIDWRGRRQSDGFGIARVNGELARVGFAVICAVDARPGRDHASTERILNTVRKGRDP